MIKIFRYIRKNFISDLPSEANTKRGGKASKYLLYAIGEIVLVVIGILIALQINNSNELRKSKIFEKEISALIDQNLEQDSILLSIELLKAKEAITLTDSLLSQVAQKKYNDRLNIWMGKIITFERFKSQSSGFEVLKSKGIETVSNNQLQLALISYYDEVLYNLYESIQDVINSFNADWVPVIKQEFLDFKWLEYCQPIDSENFFEQRSTLILFKLYKDNRTGEVRRMEKTLLKISEIKSLIKNSKL